MKAFVPNYDLKIPTNLGDALKMIQENKYQVISGGTDLMVLFEMGRLPEKTYLSLQKIPDLQGITENKNEFIIGATTTYGHIRRHQTLKNSFPLIYEAAKATGAIAIQNRGTIGGNIANASPAADTPPALLCYEAELVLKSFDSERSVKLKDFFAGYKKLDLKANEIITKIILPKTTHLGKEFSFYHKVGTREGQAISKVCLSLRLFKDKGKVTFIKCGLGSVAPTTVLAHSLEKLLLGQKLTDKLIKDASEIILNDISPIDDIRSTAIYRKKTTQNLIAYYLKQCL